MKTLLLACSVVATLAVANHATAQVTPYTADSNTTYLYSFDEAVGGGVAANTGTAGSNAIGFAGAYAGDGVDQAVNTALLGSAGFSGFGNAASIGVNNGFGVDVDGSGGFRLSDGNSTSPDDLAQSAIFGSGSFTLEALVNVSGLGTQQEIISTDAFFTAGEGGNASRGFQFRINQDSELEFQYIGDGVISPVTADITDTAVVGAGNEFVADEWFHAAITFENDGTVTPGGLANGTTNLYWTRVDSGATEANLIGTGADLVDFSDLGPLVIGNEGRINNITAVGQVLTTEPLLGLIDEVRISNVARGSDDFIFAAAVPEPSSLALLGLGAVVGLVRRRKN